MCRVLGLGTYVPTTVVFGCARWRASSTRVTSAGVCGMGATPRPPAPRSQHPQGCWWLLPARQTLPQPTGSPVATWEPHRGSPAPASPSSLLPGLNPAPLSPAQVVISRSGCGSSSATTPSSTVRTRGCTTQPTSGTCPRSRACCKRRASKGEGCFSHSSGLPHGIWVWISSWDQGGARCEV